MGNIEKILTDCIAEIKAGKMTPDECLNRYPSRRQELEPLLKMALNIKQPPAIAMDSSYKQSARTQLLRQIGTARQQKSRSLADIFSFGLPPRFAWARIAASVVIALVVISILAGGTAYAAQSSVPGDLLYPVKTTTEDARLLITASGVDKAELNLEFARIRLTEMDKLADRSEEKTVLALNRYRNNLNAAGEQIQKVSDTSTLVSLLVNSLNDLQGQMVVCDGIIDTSPTYIDPVMEASQLTVSEHVKLLGELEQQNIVRAAQINLALMQNRLQRAQYTTGRNQFQLMQEVLSQYQELNQLQEQIIQSDQSTDNQVDELTLQASSSFLDTLSSISQQVPQQYQSTIQNCQQGTLQLQNQARQRYQRGNSGTGFNQDTGSSIIQGQEEQTATQDQGVNGKSSNQTGTPATTPSPGTGSNTAGSNFDGGTSAGGDVGSTTVTTASGNGGNNSDSISGPGSGNGTGSGAVGGEGTGPGSSIPPGSTSNQEP